MRRDPVRSPNVTKHGKDRFNSDHSGEWTLVNAWAAAHSILTVADGNAATALHAARECGAGAVVIDVAMLSNPLPSRGPFPLLAVRVARTCDDVSAVLSGRPDAVLVSDCRGLADIDRVAARLAVAEAEHGLDDGAIGIVASVADGLEGLAALVGCASFAAATPRLKALTWNAERLAAAVGEPKEVATLVRGLFLAAARTAGLPALAPDGPDGPAGYLDSCRVLNRLGYAGRLTQAVARVVDINRAFGNP